MTTRPMGAAIFSACPATADTGVDQDMPDQTAVFAEPLACVLNSIEKGRIEISDDVVVITTSAPRPPVMRLISSTGSAARGSMAISAPSSRASSRRDWSGSLFPGNLGWTTRKRRLRPPSARTPSASPSAWSEAGRTKRKGENNYAGFHGKNNE